MRQAQTAIDVYHHDIEPTLRGRQLLVRQQLVAFIKTYQQDPTALELLRFVSENFPHSRFDPNSVRPRLRELWEQGFVCHAGKRVCSVSGKQVYTWQPSTPRVPLPEPIPQRLRF